MENVIDFRNKAEEQEPMVWMCDCGNCSFLILSNGEIECAECGTMASDCIEHKQTVRKWTRKQ